MFTIISCVALTVAILAAGLALAFCRFVHSRRRPLRWLHGIAAAVASGLLLSGALWGSGALGDLRFQKIVGVDLILITLSSAGSAGVIAALIVVRICKRRFAHKNPVA
jgi:hypothetical protein